MNKRPSQAERDEYESFVRAATGKRKASPSKKPIEIKPENKGKLHREMGIPQGKKIPVKKLEQEKKGASPAEKKRIVFAENVKRWDHGG